MSRSVVLAVDVGGTSIKGAVVTESGRIIATDVRPTPEVNSVDALMDMLQQLKQSAESLNFAVIAVAVVTPGIVDEEAGIVLYASNLGWRDVPLLELVTARLGVPVAIGHDVRAAGLAERLLGAAHGAANFVLVPIGTGVAAALVTAGRTITGATGAAGEFGHIPVIPNGELCTCGQRGCLEVYASGAGLARRYAARGGMQLSSRQITARLGHDQLADEVWQDAVRVLAQGLTILTLLLDPDAIVLGGGFAKAGRALLDPIRSELDAALVWRARPRVVLSVLGGDASRIGASILAFRAAGQGAVADGWTAEQVLQPHP
jgi:glucokinase